MPNGRILRTRLNIAYAMSDSVEIKDTSVYGTSQGFRGHADPGDTFSGARWFAAGKNTGASVTPVTAINMVF
jgi:hypothetical protein